ncbi:hypothetical protein ACQP2T_06450 [Nonomuraea sp. CA-143628]|uniref:hypothetical protein n=1 Tax=Nonomuraea sp. CA-143628 TaxID=3239997 RepID=UPI003D8AA2DF
MTDGDLKATLDARFDRLSSDLEKTVKKHVRQALRAEIRQEVEREVRAEIERDVHQEMAARLAGLVSEHHHLDPATILQDFVRQVTELLSGSPQPAADTLTQQELVEALRQGVLDAFRARRLHLAHLAELDSHLREATDLDSIRLLVGEWFTVTRLKRVTTPAESPECFTAVNLPTDGPYLAVVRPAYVDMATRKTVRSGQLRHTDDPASAIHDDSPVGGH